MDRSLEEDFPEAVPYIRKAVKEHGEEWVIENYFPDIVSLGVVMDIPQVDELPFFDETKHEAPTDQEQRERGEAYRKYRENLWNGIKPGEE